MKKDQGIKIRLPDEDKKKAREVAEFHGHTLSSMIRYFFKKEWERLNK